MFQIDIWMQAIHQNLMVIQGAISPIFKMKVVISRFFTGILIWGKECFIAAMRDGKSPVK